MTLWRSGVKTFMEIHSRYLIYSTIILLLFGCAKKEDKIDAQSKIEGTEKGREAEPHPTLPVPVKEADEKEKKNIEQAQQIMARIHDYRERLNKNPKDLEAIIKLGNANHDMRRWEEAKGLYVRALEIDPKNLFVRTDLASTYVYMGDADKAILELNKVLSIDRKHEAALYNLGVILLNNKKDPDRAIKVWEELISYNPHANFSRELKKKVAELKKSKNN